MSKPTLVSVVALGGRTERSLLALAAGAARGLEPRVGAAILESAAEREVPVAAADGIHETMDAGVIASVDGHIVVVGSAALFDGLGLSIEPLGDWPTRLEQRGQAVLLVAVDGRIAGLLGVADAATSRLSRASRAR